MFEQKVLCNLDRLESHLDVIEDGKEVRYLIYLAPDRINCRIVRELYGEEGDLNIGAEPIERREETRALDELKDDPSIPHHLLWVARGMWGIPNHFGQDPSKYFAVPSLRDVIENAAQELIEEIEETIEEKPIARQPSRTGPRGSRR